MKNCQYKTRNLRPVMYNHTGMNLETHLDLRPVLYNHTGMNLETHLDIHDLFYVNPRHPQRGY